MRIYKHIPTGTFAYESYGKKYNTPNGELIPEAYILNGNDWVQVNEVDDNEKKHTWFDMSLAYEAGTNAGILSGRKFFTWYYQSFDESGKLKT